MCIATMEIYFNFLKQWILIVKISINRNGKKLTVSRKNRQNFNR